jgi:Skp family chaperone for outer membrane proteins
MSETKLAIDDLYERIKEHSQKRVTSSNANGEESGEPNETTTSHHDMKSWYDKLHAIQFRIMDLQDITAQFEEEAGKKPKRS